VEALRLTSVYKDYIWGGNRLKTEYGKKCDRPRVAESWELSCHPGGLSLLRGTKTTLRDWLAGREASLRGFGYANGEGFPLIVKLIDAKERLSVQVHPGDDYARAHEGGAGKTELWYVMDHEPGAFVYLGFRRDVTKGEIRSASGAGSLESLLNRVEVRRGDVFFLPAGTVHAIGEGRLLAEIQQSSDLTYRLYDYGRAGNDGKARELHVEKALDVMNTSATRWIPIHRRILMPATESRQVLVGSHSAFSVFEVDVPHHATFALCPEGFTYLLIIDGNCSLNLAGADYALAKGDGLFLPPGGENYTVDGSCLCLRVHGTDVLGKENIGGELWRQ
jgi:mannose-6-phosphate isomerase